MTVRYKMIVVEWQDSAARQGGAWFHVADAENHKAASIHTAGFLMKEADTHITLVQSYDTSNGNVSGVFTIPKGCIKCIRVLEVSNEETHEH